MNYTTILYAVFASVIYSGSFYLKNRISGKETFDPEKMAATILVGVAIGFISAVTGSPLSEQNIIDQLLAYGGTIIVIETWLKTVFRGAKQQEQLALAMQGLAAAIGLRKEQPPKPETPTPTAPEPEGSVPITVATWQPAEVWQDDEQTYKLVDAQITDLMIVCSKPVPMEIADGFSNKQIGIKGRILKPDGTPETRPCTVTLNMISPGPTITTAQELQVKTDADGRFEARGYYWIPHNFTFSPDVKTWPGATCVLVYGSGWGGQNRVYRGFIKGFTIQFD